MYGENARDGTQGLPPDESLTFQYERNPQDPRVAHAMTLEVDDYGVPRKTVSIGYPRRSAHSEHDEQNVLRVVMAETEVLHHNGSDAAHPEGVYRLGIPLESKSFHVTGLSDTSGRPLTVDNPAAFEHMYTELVDGMPQEDPHETDPASQPTNEVRKRLLSHTQATYYGEDISETATAISFGQAGPLALPYETLTAVFSEAHINRVFEGVVAADGELGLATGTMAALLADPASGYRNALPSGITGLWWSPSGRQVFDESRFYLPTVGLDPFGNRFTTSYDDNHLLIEQSVDPVGNTVTATNDYRVLQPWQLTDPNDNRTQVRFDDLGMVVATAVMGKVGDIDGDTLDDPTVALEYDLFQVPAVVHTTAKETHGPTTPTTRFQHRYTYSDGAGNIAQEKVQAEPGDVPQRNPDGSVVIVDGEVQLEHADTRWVGTGRTVLDNKGNVVKQYEPFFSHTEAYEDERTLTDWGVTPRFHYDPVGRNVRTDFPDGTFARVEFDPWQSRSFDPNDTVLDGDWYAQRQTLPASDPERIAADQAADHANTPQQTHLDSLGRPFLVIDDNTPAGGPETHYETRSELDIEGNVLRIEDARGNTAATNIYGMGGVQLHTRSADAGPRWSLANVVGNPLRSYDRRDDTPITGADSPTASTAAIRTYAYRYDALNRPLTRTVQTGAAAAKTLDVTVYGETLAIDGADPKQTNHRGQVYRVYDGAGEMTAVAYDFKANLVEQQRRLAVSYTQTPDWTPAADELLAANGPAAIQAAVAADVESEAFTSAATFDALNRIVTSTTPDGSVTTNTYNAASLLETVSVSMHGRAANQATVTSIDYNAKGQRTLIAYGNGTVTTYQYDPNTFRVRRIHTERGAGHSERTVQDLRYTYDPVGNVTRLDDAAQQGIYFANAYVDAHQSFVYDALYRLTQAEGRELADLDQDSWRTKDPIPHPQSDPHAQRRYTQTYSYDEVGNLTRVRHSAGGNGWTRAYQTSDDGNRLRATGIGSETEDPTTFGTTYPHNNHGQMLAMPHLSTMAWDENDRLQSVDRVGGGMVYFVYDGAGQRVRKVAVNVAGVTSRERIYVGGWETYRERTTTDLTTPSLLERETLHISDDSGRVALVETLVRDSGSDITNPTSRFRYQYSNHLGSASVELDDGGNVISYEEYYPFGDSSYRAHDSTLGVTPSRYRYTSKERDEETALYYHGARYYSSWLGRWTAADPIGLGDGVNRFAYVSNNPVRLVDPGGTAGEPALEDVQASLREANQALAESKAGSDLARQQVEEIRILRELEAQAGATEATRGETSIERGFRQRREQQAKYETVVTRQAAARESSSRTAGAVLQVAGGSVEVVGGAAAIVAPEPTGATKVGGAALIALGLDQIAAGLATLATGRSQETVLHEGTRRGLEGVGVSPETASTTASVVEFGAHVTAGVASSGGAAPGYSQGRLNRALKSGEFEHTGNPNAAASGTVEVAARGPTAAGGVETTRVGRWMSSDELEAMEEFGVLQESAGGLTHVTNPANPEAFKAAKPGSVFVEFDVPTSAVKPGGRADWGTVHGPNSVRGRLAKRRGEELEMPNVTNINVTRKK